MGLRPYQIKAKNDTYAAWQAGHRNVLMVQPTGGGKTRTFSEIISEFDGPSVAIAHRQELVSQISLALGGYGVRHNIIAPEKTIRNIETLHMQKLGRRWVDRRAHTNVAGVDTLIRMDENDAMFKRTGLWVCDESHHPLKKNKWGRAVEMFPNAYGLGVTATPIRADGCGLGSHADGVFDTMIMGPSPRALINAGYLTDYRIFAPQSDLDLTNVDVGASGEYVAQQLRDAVHKSHITGDVVSNYLKIAPGKLAIVFAVDVEHATEISRAFRDAGVASEVVSGKTPDILRAEIMRRFEAREVSVLVNVDLFGEGVDVPAVEVVIMARPTQSFSLFAQQFGRALRLFISPVLMAAWDTYTPEQRLRFIADSEKPVAVIIDHVKNWQRHGLPDAERTYTLDRRERRTRNSMPDSIPTRTCTNVPESTGVICMNVYERTEKYCPACGCKPEPAARSAPEFVDGDLYELDLNALRFLRGEADKIMGAPAIPHGATDIIAQAIRNRHKEKQSAQVTLREIMAQWGGVQVHNGHNDPSYQQRLFYLTFGIDVLSAQALPRKEAEDLTDKIIKRIAIDMTVNKDQTAV